MSDSRPRADRAFGGPAKRGPKTKGPGNPVTILERMRKWGSGASLIPFLGGSNSSKKKKKSRQCPTLPPGCPGSTIGDGGLNCRVRNGNGCDPSSKITGKISWL